MTAARTAAPDRHEGRRVYLFGHPYEWHQVAGQWQLHPEPAAITAIREQVLAAAERLTTQTPGVGVEGEAHADAGHQPDWLLEEMNRQAAAGIPNLDNIGTCVMEYDGPRCAADDCDTAVDNDGELCEQCGDQPHEFRHNGIATRPDWCACGRIRASELHTDEVPW